MSQVRPIRPRVKSSVPWGLIGMAVLVAAIERHAIRDNPRYLGGVATVARFKSQFVRSKAPGRDILYLGDSMLQFGVLPKVIERHTGRSGYNLGVQAAPAPASDFLLRRALRAGARPSTIVIAFAPRFLADRPWRPDHLYPWSDLLRLHEAIELSWAMREPDLLAKILIGQCLHSYKDRHEIRNNILSALKGEGAINHVVLPFLWRNWNQNDGAQANAVTSYQETPAPYTTPPEGGDWTCDPVNEHYVHDILELAARNRITVYWLIAPFSPVTQGHWEHAGNDARFVRFLRAQLARFPNLAVVDARHAGFESRVFVDAIHLDRDGAIALSSGLADVLQARPGPRWVTLPPYREPAFDAPVEDLAKSALARRMIQSNGKH